MIDIIENCCSPYYLQMFIKMVPSLDKWQVEYEDYNKINLRKLNLIEGEKIKEDFLSGIGVGLFSRSERSQFSIIFKYLLNRYIRSKHSLTIRSSHSSKYSFCPLA